MPREAPPAQVAVVDCGPEDEALLALLTGKVPPFEVRVYLVYTMLRARVIFAEWTARGEPGYGELLSKRTPVPV